MRIPERLRPWLLLGLVAFGVRCAAIAWNADRLFGDVNLFALVARDWVDHGTLNYPGKYDFSEASTYATLSSPAGQHPSAWPWLGGVVANLLGTRDTYFALQLCGLVGGLLVVAAGARLAWLVGGRRAALWCGGALALHPYLVDYSANGSPFIWLGLATLTIPLAALEPRLSAWTAGLVAGLAVGIAISVHGAGLALLPFGLIALFILRDRQRVATTASCLLVAGLVLLPTCLWMHTHFGSWWHTTTTDYLLGKLGRIALVEQADGIRLIKGSLQWSDLPRALGLATVSTGNYLLHLACELGWLGLVGLGLGIAGFRRSPEQRRLGLALALIALGVGLPCWLWPSFKFRFLAGLLPLAVWLVALAASRSTRFPRWAGGAVIGVLIFWGAQIVLTRSPAKYYAFDLEHRADYADMRAVAAVLAAQPPGVVLSFNQTLDGGTAAAYWHEHPFVSARGHPDAFLRRHAETFNVAYLWLSPERAEAVATLFPQASLLHAGDSHWVYSLPQIAHD
ncbi:MAG: hypothetical protein ABII82_02220 [Verrucomicrobiota bacterium]